MVVKTRLVAVTSWLAATLTATVLVAGAVGAIRDTTRRDATLVATSAASDRATASAPTTTTAIATTTVAPPAASSTPAPGPLPSTTTRGGAGAPGTTSVLPPAPATTAAPAGATNGPAPTNPPPTAAPSTTSATTTRTIASVGGTATIRFGPTAVTVVAATPNAGYTAKVDQRGTTAVRVEFTASGHRSRLEAWWADGPQEDVRED